jgi:hypothetical protein
MYYPLSVHHQMFARFRIRPMHVQPRGTRRKPHPRVEEELTMPDNGDAASHPYAQLACTAILAAVREQHDFGGCLVGDLSGAAAELGSSEALIASWPGSLGADLVRQLVDGAVGWDGDCRADYREPLL